MKIQPLKLKDDGKHYNVNKAVSYNAFINIILGGRGIGKTTGHLIKAVKDRMNKDEEFIYLRRYKSETQKTKRMLNKYIDAVSIEGYGTSSFAWKQGKEVIGYSVNLSTAITFKSNDFPKVTSIIFDEGVLKPHGNYRYLKDEVVALLEFISTVFRERVNCKVYILGNNLDIFNPYFEYFNIPPFKTTYYDKDRSILCMLCKDSIELRKEEVKTPLYKLTKNTSYGDYHYNNEILVMKKGNIAPKEFSARLVARVVLNSKSLNLYLQTGLTLYVEFKNKVIKDSMSYIILENDNVNYMYIKRLKESVLLKYLYTCYYDNSTIYSDSKAVDLFSSFMDLI